MSDKGAKLAADGRIRLEKKAAMASPYVRAGSTVGSTCSAMMIGGRMGTETKHAPESVDGSCRYDVCG